ncbi:MAG: DUF503 domain-containing protein [Gemmatimonadota bacterium]
MAAVVGVARWVLHLPGCRSLKMKRSIVRSLKGRLQAEFRISVAETEYLDLWQKAELCAAVVASDRRLAEALLGRLDRHLSSDPRARVIEHETVFY